MHYGRQVPVHVRRRVPDETHSIVAWQTQIVLVLLVFREFRALPIRRWHWFVDFSNCSDDIFIQQYIRESCLLMLVRYPTRKSFRSVHAYVRACVRAVRGLREAVWHFWFLFLFLLLELAVLAGLVGSLVSSLVDSLVDSLVCSIVGGSLEFDRGLVRGLDYGSDRELDYEFERALDRESIVDSLIDSIVSSILLWACFSSGLPAFALFLRFVFLSYPNQPPIIYNGSNDIYLYKKCY